MLEENGLSTQNFSLEISSAYDKLRTELEELVEKWAQFIRMAVIVKDPQPRTPADREILGAKFRNKKGESPEQPKSVKM